MTDSNHRAMASTIEEQASLYVLGLLDAPDRRLFESRLRTDAELRGLVQGLQSGLESEVFGESAVPAPARIWGKILERTRDIGGPVLLFPRPLVHVLSPWVPPVLAAAACLLMGFFIHAWWASPRDPATTIAAVSSPTGLPHSNSSTRSVAGTPAIAGPQDSGKSRSSTVTDPDPGSPGASVVLADAAARSTSLPVDPEGSLEAVNAALQGKIRALNAQVADLSQSLKQAVFVPSGVTRLHVFPLGQQEPVSAIPANLVDGSARTNSLVESLARMAGERMVVALSGTAGSGSVQDAAGRLTTANEAQLPGQSIPDANPRSPSVAEPVGKVALVPAQPLPPETVSTEIPGLTVSGAADVVSIGRGMLRSAPVSVSPIVFGAPDAGVYAVAVPTAPTSGQYQLWSRASDGTVSSLGVLTASPSPVSVFTFERGSADGLFLSLEPIGGSLQPTGPLVGGQNPVLPGLGRP